MRMFPAILTQMIVPCDAPFIRSNSAELFFTQGRKGFAKKQSNLSAFCILSLRSLREAY